MIKHIGSTQEWAKWRFTREQWNIIDNDFESTSIYLAIYRLAEARGSRQLTMKQIKKMNNLIDDLNRQMMHALLRLSVENNAR